ncbi:hypothetical protein LZM69_23925, partial [Pseudomonas aeruginosa]|nr:hypothetical protein [Pseudomonas aeruginosa]
MTLLTELLDELRHPAVRDLAWTLLAPPLLRRAVGGMLASLL